MVPLFVVVWASGLNGLNGRRAPARHELINPCYNWLPRVQWYTASKVYLSL
jgi:hypothetical protein